MKIKIQGTEYDVATLNKLSLFDLLELKKQTGLSVDDLQQTLADSDGASLMGSGDGLLVVGSLIWLTRRKAGEALTFEQACDFPLDALEFIEEESDQPAAPPDPL